jgi:DNA-binding HxlR family transcriptional regulator
VELIGRRWTGAIVAVLLADGPLRFSELKAEVPGLSDRVLTQRLRELETEELVERAVHPGPPLRVEYALTPKGVGLEPVVRALESWGQRWMSCGADGAPKADAARATTAS